MRIAMFGGSFDPVHWGHLLLAETLREVCRLDHVLFVPAGIPPHKRQQRRTSGRHRVDMLELAISGNNAFAVECFEIERDAVSYTVDTLLHLRDAYRGADLFLLVGADMYYDLPNWYQADAIRQLATIVAVGRPGAPLPALRRWSEEEATNDITPRDAGFLVEMPCVELSSTEIRRRVADGRGIRYRVPTAVEEYIREHGLYRDAY